MITIWIIFIPLIFLLAFWSRTHQIAKWGLIGLLSFIVGFGGLNAEDHYNYEIIYSNSTSISFSFASIFEDGFSFEPAFLILNYFCKSIGLGYAGYFCVIAFLTNSLMLLGICRFQYPIASFFVVYFVSFFLFEQTNLLRQCLAISIICFVIIDLSEGNLVRYIVGVLIASQFHMSAYIFLLFAFFVPFLNKGNKVINEIMRYALVLIVVISLFIGYGIIEFDLLGFLSFASSYSKYVINEKGVGLTVNIVTLFLINAPTILVLLNKRLFNLNYVYVTFISVACITINLGIQYEFILRLAYYFQPFTYLFFVQYLSEIRKYNEAIYNINLISNNIKSSSIVFHNVLLGFVYFYCSYVVFYDYLFTNHPKVFDKVYPLSSFFYN